MYKREYEAIAKILNAANLVRAPYPVLVGALADWMQTEYDGFDRARFIRNCGMEDTCDAME